MMLENVDQLGLHHFDRRTLSITSLVYTVGRKFTPMEADQLLTLYQPMTTRTSCGQYMPTSNN